MSTCVGLGVDHDLFLVPLITFDRVEPISREPHLVDLDWELVYQTCQRPPKREASSPAKWVDTERRPRRSWPAMCR